MSMTDALRAMRYAESDEGRREWREAAPADFGSSLGAALADIARQTGVAIISPDDRDPTPDELRSLPSTPALEAALTTARAELERLASDPHQRAYRDQQGRVKRAERYVLWGWRRDGIVADWSDNCRCFGDGRVHVGPATDDGQGRAYRACPCPAGDELRHRLGREREEQAATRFAELWPLTFADADDSLGGYEHVTLDTYLQRLASYPLDVQAAGRRIVNRLTAWLDDPGAWLVLYGATGAGKTGLAVSCCRALAERGFRSSTDTEQHLLDRIRDTYNRKRYSEEPTERDVIEDLKRVPVLLIDDMGAPGRMPSDWAQGKLFDILNARYSTRRATIITTNLADGDGSGSLTQYVGPRVDSRLHERTRQGRWILRVSEPDLREAPELFR